MKTRLIRILGTVLSVFGVTTTANASDTGFCYNPTARDFSSRDTHDVVRYTIDTGNTWFVAWPNKEYKGSANTKPWSSGVAEFVAKKTFNGGIFYSFGLGPNLAYSGMPDLSGLCVLGVEPGDTAFDEMSGIAGRNICVMGGDGLTFYSAETGVFKYFGCCYTGYATTSSTGSGTGHDAVSWANCPCIYRKADGSGHYDSEYGEIITYEVVEQIRTYEFINCADGYYQETDENGNSTTVNNGFSSKTVFKIHPGFGWSTDFDFASADPCVIPGVGTANSFAYCKNNGCSQTGTNGWFGGYIVSACSTACPKSDSYVYGPPKGGKLVFADTVVSGASNITALISTVGQNSCKLASYIDTDSKGTITYDCNSTYK